MNPITAAITNAPINPEASASLPSAAAEPMVYVHPFQTAGVGVAPYSFITVVSMPSKSLNEANPEAYMNALRDVSDAAHRFNVSLGSCEVCGMMLQHNAIIRDAKGVYHVVGCDCVMKTGDSELVTAAEAAKRDIERETRRQAAQRREEARIAAFRAGKQKEAAKNGGRTLDECFNAAQAANKAVTAAECAFTQEEETGWVLRNLRRASSEGNFLYSVTAELEHGKSILSFSPRAVEIIAKIWAKVESGKTRGAQFEQAVEQFHTTLNGMNDREAAAQKAHYACNREIIAAIDAAKKGNGIFVPPARIAAAFAASSDSEEAAEAAPIAPVVAEPEPRPADLPESLDWIVGQNGIASAYPKDGDMDTYVIMYRPHLRREFPALYLMPWGEFAEGPNRAAGYSLLDLRRCVIQITFPDGKKRMYTPCASFGSVEALRRWEAVYEEWKAAKGEGA